MLLVATRDLGGRQTGRKAVLRTIVASLSTLGHDVHVVTVADGEEPADELPNMTAHRLRRPGLVRVSWNVLRYFVMGRLSLNECLFYSPKGAQAVAALARRIRADVLVCDTIRAVPLTADTELPRIVDLDDLYSHRYAAWARGHEPPKEVLGYYGDGLPRVVFAAASWIAMRALTWEARAIAKRETVVAREAEAVSLVAEEEAVLLSRAAGVPVRCLPMAVPIADVSVSVGSVDQPSFVFTGGLDYHPNRAAVRWFEESVLSLARATIPRFSMTIVGHCPDDAKEELLAPGLVFAGYVEDLGAELRRHHGFVAPILAGTGIQTKVVEAMGLGLPVVATSEAVRGLSVEHENHCYVADSPADIVRCLKAVLDSHEEAADMGRRGRDHVAVRFAPQVLRRRWEMVLDEVLSSRHGATVARPQITV